MNLDENIEKLQKKVEKNADKINDNAERIRQNSIALEILRDYKNDKTRLYKLLLISISVWLITLSYLVYLLSK